MLGWLSWQVIPTDLVSLNATLQRIAQVAHENEAPKNIGFVQQSLSITVYIF